MTNSSSKIYLSYDLKNKASLWARRSQEFRNKPRESKVAPVEERFNGATAYNVRKIKPAGDEAHRGNAGGHAKDALKVNNYKTSEREATKRREISGWEKTIPHVHGPVRKEAWSETGAAVPINSYIEGDEDTVGTRSTSLRLLAGHSVIDNVLVNLQGV